MCVRVCVLCAVPATAAVSGGFAAGDESTSCTCEYRLSAPFTPVGQRRLDAIAVLVVRGTSCSCCVIVRVTNCSCCVSVRWAVWILAVLVVSVCGILTSCCVSVLWAVWILGVLVSVCVGLAGYPEEAEQFGHRTGSSCSVLLYVHKP